MRIQSSAWDVRLARVNFSSFLLLLHAVRIRQERQGWRKACLNTQQLVRELHEPCCNWCSSPADRLSPARVASWRLQKGATSGWKHPFSISVVAFMYLSTSQFKSQSQVEDPANDTSKRNSIKWHGTCKCSCFACAQPSRNKLLWFAKALHSQLRRPESWGGKSSASQC